MLQLLQTDVYQENHVGLDRRTYKMDLFEGESLHTVGVRLGSPRWYLGSRKVDHGPILLGLFPTSDQC